MTEKRMNDMGKELLVAGLRNHQWESHSITELLMIARLISSMESVKDCALEYRVLEKKSA